MRHDLAGVGRPTFRVERVVAGRRVGPCPGPRIEAVQEACRVGCVGPGVERIVQRREGIRVVHQVDLHAAHVHRAHAAVLQGARRVHGSRLGGVVVSRTLGVDRPGPWLAFAGVGIGMPALDHPDGVQQARRRSGGTLRLRDGLAAWRRCRARRDQAEAEQDGSQGCGSHAGIDLHAGIVSDPDGTVPLAFVLNL